MYGLLGLGPSGLGLPSPTTLSDMPVSRSNNVSTSCSTARRPLRFARSSLEIQTHDRTSVNHTILGITSAHIHRIVSAVTMTTTVTTTDAATTTEGDQTTAMTDVVMTNTEQRTIMTEMTDTFSGIHVLTGRTLIEDRATIDVLTTIVVGTLLKTNRIALFLIMSHEPTRLPKSP